MNTQDILTRDAMRYNFTDRNATKGVNVINSRDALDKYLIPVQKTSLSYVTPSGEIRSTKDYEAIVDNKGSLISIVRDSYKLVTNKEVINPMIDQLEKLDNKWYIDNSHSFISPERMRIQITFPELMCNDGKSDIALSLFIGNSYDGSKSVNMMIGAIRAICTNGMIFGKVFAKAIGRHTSNFNFDNLQRTIEVAYDNIPSVSQRIEELYHQTFTLNETYQKSIKENFGTRGLAYVIQQNMGGAILNEWEMYNVLTYYISHYINYKARERYQENVSKMFKF